MAETCTWIGKSGTGYLYTIYSMNTDWSDVPGNYIFTKKNTAGRWEAIYIGQTESFKKRLPNHEALPCVKRHGGTHIHAHVNDRQAARLAEETDLIRNYNPPCNG